MENIIDVLNNLGNIKVININTTVFKNKNYEKNTMSTIHIPDELFELQKQDIETSHS